jgi:hypothetical protein
MVVVPWVSCRHAQKETVPFSSLQLNWALILMIKCAFNLIFYQMKRKTKLLQVVIFTVQVTVTSKSVLLSLCYKWWLCSQANLQKSYLIHSIAEIFLSIFLESPESETWPPWPHILIPKLWDTWVLRYWAQEEQREVPLAGEVSKQGRQRR